MCQFFSTTINLINYIMLLFGPYSLLYLCNYNKATTSPENATSSLVCEMVGVTFPSWKIIGEKYSLVGDSIKYYQNLQLSYSCGSLGSDNLPAIL